MSHGEKKTWKSDELREIEKKVQSEWKESANDLMRLTQVDLLNKKTFFATFPYPYMNGYLHLGHAFTMSKQDFACRYYRMIGHNVLEPFSFHLTGMPIVAAADKLKEDIKKIKQGTVSTSIITPQYEIMKMMDIPEPEIEKFEDPLYWGKFFPRIAMKTLKKFGIKYDETRSFITTDVNPYYDSFVKWQFSILFKKQALRFGTRYCIYSMHEKQPCLGHERSIGEEAKPKKYWFVPYQINDFKHNDEKLTDGNTYIIATTSRPETLFGVTNLWIDSEQRNDYMLYQVETNTGTMYWIIRELAINGLFNQYRETDCFHIKSMKNIGKVDVNQLTNLKVIDHINNKQIPIIPCMNYIDPLKGSGIKTSVPSDDPRDYGIITRKKIAIEPIPCIMYNLPEYQGNLLAVDLTEKMNEPMILNIYFNQSDNCTMTAGKYKGMTALEARTRIENELIVYYEPDIHAFSRSGHPLIVAKHDQWFIDYGDQNWKEKTLSHVEQMTFSDHNVKELLIGSINWLDQWPCSRTYGMGSHFPSMVTESEYLIDSLSDSTIYMALYTIYHYFEELKIDPSELTEQTWDYIFLLKDYENDTYKKFKPLRDEFIYWYPMNLRVSAKDLIQNHLAMSIFNHVMIWDEEFKQRLGKYYPEKNQYFGPMRYEINGYITVQRQDQDKNKNEIEKMSKSKGNFKTLDQVIDMYSADSVRFTLASASSGMDDSYFDQDLCTKMIEKLHKEKEWISQVFSHHQINNDAYTYPEIVFINEMNQIIKETIYHYDQMNFRAAVTSGFHLMQKCRDNYLEMVRDNDYNSNVLVEFIKTQLTLMYPIIPHFCDNFRNHFASKYVIDQQMVVNLPIDMMLRWKHHYVMEIGSDIMKKIFSFSKKKPVNKITIYVTNEVTDPIESVIRQIISDGLLPENKQMIDRVAIIHPELTKDNKSIGSLIKYYNCIKELISVYGHQMYDDILKNGEEFNALTNCLNYYLKFKKSDNIMIDIVKYSKNTDTKGIHNVRTCDPVIYFGSND